MALLYFIAGVFCIHRAARLVEWAGNALQRTRGDKRPQWLQGRGIIVFIRLIGFVAMFNAIALFYSAFYAH